MFVFLFWLAAAIISRPMKTVYPRAHQRSHVSGQGWLARASNSHVRLSGIHGSALLSTCIFHGHVTFDTFVPTMASQLFSLGAWYFLPNVRDPFLLNGNIANASQLATGWLQSFYYRVSTPAGERFPQPGEPRWIKHRKNIFVLVVATYLLYTIYEADWTLQRQSDFYKDLGVPVDVDEKKLQSHFRRL
jgi:hypothetical protein